MSAPKATTTKTTTRELGITATNHTHALPSRELRVMCVYFAIYVVAVAVAIVAV